LIPPSLALLDFDEAIKALLCALEAQPFLLGPRRVLGHPDNFVAVMIDPATLATDVEPSGHAAHLFMVATPCGQPC
jgi:hypothetical protein